MACQLALLRLKARSALRRLGAWHPYVNNYLIQNERALLQDPTYTYTHEYALTHVEMEGRLKSFIHTCLNLLVHPKRAVAAAWSLFLGGENALIVVLVVMLLLVLYRMYVKKNRRDVHTHSSGVEGSRLLRDRNAERGDGMQESE